MNRYLAESSPAAVVFFVLFIIGLTPLHAEPPMEQLLRQADDLAESGRHTEALDLYKKAAGTEPARTEPYRGIIKCYRALGDTAGAAAFMESVYLDNPENAAACYGLGYCLYVRKKYENALTYFEKAIELDSDMPEAWNNCAAIYHFILRDYGKAAAHYRKAIQLSKKCGNNRVRDIAEKNLANLPSPEETQGLHAELSLEEFINEFIAAVEKNSDRALRLLIQGQQKNTEQAFAWFLKQARSGAAGGDTAREQKALALCSLLEKHYRAAFRSDLLLTELERYEKMTDMQKQHMTQAEMLIEKAEKHDKNGDSDAAASAYRKAGHIYKTAGDKEREGQVLLYLGDLYRRHGSHRKARTAYSDALTCFIEVRREPQKAQALCSLGINAYRLGEKDDAVDFLERSLIIYTQLEDSASAEKVRQNLEIVKNR